MISLDTNVLIYALDPGTGAKHSRARDIVAETVAAPGVIALQVLAEFVAVARRKARSFEDALAYIAQVRSTYRLVAADADAFDSAVRIVREHNLSFWDAMLWATLDAVGCRALLTEDFQDGRTLGGITFLNPFNPANNAAIARLMRPLR
jgi:predicted nucleic acid-binding protein